MELTTLAWISLILGILTAIAIAADVRRHPQHMSVMNITWPITGLYLPVIGWWIYKALGHKGHGDKPFWQSVFISTSHCGGGCTLGDTLAAPLISLTGFTLLGSALLGHFVGEFIAAFIMGIAFQLWPMMEMGETRWIKALKKALVADALSLIAFEVGMFGFMSIAVFGFLAEEPGVFSADYWFLMQIAMIIGFATAYPANAWLVKRGIKHGM
ncbi:DUF4396 domain-containing protein [Pokkaliibacter sp. CJK22405]|uniref:DUF4396 domain-containing protein n=1 Tax=Pokkaliibacter sp. CJK22405 TaxID=3384615 RepID=UPI0039853387